MAEDVRWLRCAVEGCDWKISCVATLGASERYGAFAALGEHAREAHGYEGMASG